jgi:peptidoglycan LD-endopeptidase CwlK
MYKFSRAGMDKLVTCHPDLQCIMLEVVKWTDCSIFCGHRGKEEQDKAYFENKSKVKYPNSFHNAIPSRAVDAGPYFVEIQNTDWNDRIAFAMFAGRVLQIADQLLKEGKIKHTLTWGGDWDNDGRNLDQSFHDLPHFQLVKLPAQ